MTTIEASGLCKRYGARIALDGLTFTADTGEVIGLLGPNGAGKTTAIRLLTTILEPTGGTFTVAGIPGDQPHRIRQRIGVLPESAGYPGRQSGAEYLRYAARLFGRSRPDARTAAERLLADVGLSERAGARIATYSRGMKQRLGIARALVNDPAVVFLDEPTLGLDPAGQGEILATISDVARQRGATVVLSTHTLTEVEQVCDNLLILDRGKLRAAGPIAEIVAGAGSLSSAFLHLTGQDSHD
ncbi:ABC transporter ATP-binding protein [Kribbella pratensis]|uniref:ABC-2 type transport system ATP-binding protein n=1 Tax=Kribbella pratensis TaxID=2512112 RepID=A0A4R8CM99_9ACTN|nr:ABC transporter ATP-binding protein [Kribbella pratensis]TDW77191.1 ABC-2 type transport system ATP-binding protein [Kribbella pratensis]